MKYRLLAVAFLLASCSSRPTDYLPDVKDLRSAAAEWALVNRQAAQGKLTRAYLSGMHEAVRREVSSAARALDRPGAPARERARALRALPDDASPDLLLAHARALKRIESVLEHS